TRLGEPYVKRIDEAMQPHLFVPDRPPAVHPAALGDLGGAVGATLLIPKRKRKTAKAASLVAGVDEPAVERLLSEQRRYYSARALESGDWWFRRARYALDAEAEEGWFADVAELEAEPERFAPRGDVLELAAGRGTGRATSYGTPIESPPSTRRRRCSNATAPS